VSEEEHSTPGDASSRLVVARGEGKVGWRGALAEWACEVHGRAVEEEEEKRRMRRRRLYL